MRRMHDGRPGQGFSGGPGGPGQPEERPLTDEEIQQRLELLRQIDPELAERIAQWRERNPERVSSMLRHHWRLANMLELKERDPELYDLRIKDLKLNKECFELIDKMRDQRAAGKADDAEKTKTELVAKIGEHFDVRQEVRERELILLEKRLDEMRQRLVERQGSKDKLVQERLEVLVGERKGPDW